MADIEKALGHQLESLPVAWNQRDLLLYAIGIGAKKEELDYLYELHPQWKAFPTYPLVLNLKGHTEELTNFDKIRQHGGTVPGLPKVDPGRLVHFSQSIDIIHPIPAVSGDGWKLTKKIVGVHDKGGKGMIVEMEMELRDPNEKVFTRLLSSSYNFGNFNLNGYTKSVASPSSIPQRGKPPSRDPDHVFVEKTSDEQALLYRLSGDYNPLHADPAIGKKIGMGGVILHGLNSYGHAARAIVQKVCGGDGQYLKAMSARFTSPVIPGNTLETLIWVSKAGQGDEIVVDFSQRIKETGKFSLGGGVAVVKAKSGSKL